MVILSYAPGPPLTEPVKSTRPDRIERRLALNVVDEIKFSTDAICDLDTIGIPGLIAQIYALPEVEEENCPELKHDCVDPPRRWWRGIPPYIIIFSVHLGPGGRIGLIEALWHRDQVDELFQLGVTAAEAYGP
jgi:hypothetical protein